MADIEDKENMSPVRRSPQKLKKATASLSPSKHGRKGRSKSIGPGGLDGTLDQDTHLSPDKNRRKSSFAPAVKSILPSKEDEAKRREARRKSLANRRVSFAPEATLHTWDVIEYMRETTTSSASSESTRRASSASQSPNGTSPTREVNSDPTDPPSTPPEQADEPSLLPTSPAHQRDLHQKKRRRSSAIPPLNFNDPDEDYSSSPISGSSPMVGSDGLSEESEDDEGVEDGDSTAMSLDIAESTVDITTRSENAESTSDSSARLEAALTEAARQAGTRGIGYDEYGDMSMELATEEVTNAFKPWEQQSVGLTSMAKNLIAVQDQENVNPFSPAFRAGIGPRRPSTINEEDENDDMSMDMTRAMGGIMRSVQRNQTARFADDETMDFTQAIGKIHEPAPARIPQLKSALKRRLSTTETGSPLAETESNSTNHQTQLHANKRRRSSAVRSSLGDATMDLTPSIGGIESSEHEDASMDLTMAIGSIQTRGSPVKARRRSSLRSRRSSVVSSAFDEQTMDFTTAVGAIKSTGPVQNEMLISEGEVDEEEEMSMEFTTVIGEILKQDATEDIARPTTPHNISPRSEQPMTPQEQDRFREASDLSAKKLLTPILELQAQASLGHASFTESKSPVSGRRQSLRSHSPANVTPRPLLSVQQVKSTRKSPKQSLKTRHSPKNESIDPQPPVPKMALTPQSSPRLKNEDNKEDIQTTPIQEQVFQQDLPSPILEKQLRSSPFKAASSPREAPSEASRTLSESIKMLSTPRKEVPTSPLKRLKELTPKRTPLRRGMGPRLNATPKTFSPASAKKDTQDSVSRQLSDDLLRSVQRSEPATKIHLNDFLDLAGIRFMDLTTTKRRYTVAPTPAKGRAHQEETDTNVDEDPAEAFEDAVVAGVCTIPELELYQHSCRELKRYISEGKAFMKNLETEVYNEPPSLIQAYVTASPSHRIQLVSHLRDAKTEARLQSKEIWYGWRSQLLQGLEDGLRKITNGLEADSSTLSEREAILEGLLPSLLEKQEAMQEEAQTLEEDAAAVPEEDKEELDSTRQRLAEVIEDIRGRRRLLESLEKDLGEQVQLLDLYTESKVECLGAIQESARVKESCRGWSIDEIAETKETVARLERGSGWSVSSASSTTLTMVYQNQLQLFFDTASFLPNGGGCDPGNSLAERDNRPISLIYIADSLEHHPQPLTTDKRFFLQLIRAQLHCLPQHSTLVRDLLNFVSDGWNTATRVHESLRRLQMEHVLDVSILSDERLGIQVSVLLPKVETKVHLRFELAACTTPTVSGPGFRVQTDTQVVGKVVYGEQYKEQKMSDSIMKRIGGKVEGWEEAVRDLKMKLEATGRKGTQA